MQTSKRRPVNSHNFTSNDVSQRKAAARRFSEEKLRQIIKNVRRAADNFIVPRNGDGESDGRKFSCQKARPPEVGGGCEPTATAEWTVSCRRPTEHEIDKLMQGLTSAKSCDEPDRQSFLAIVDEQQVELELKEEAAPATEAASEALSDGEIESEESEISTASSNASLDEIAELPADVEDNLTYSTTSDESRPSSSYKDIEAELESSFFSEPPAEEMERMTFAMRPIEPDSDGAESYCETLSVDRPIIQVRIRSLPASFGIRLARIYVPPSDVPNEQLIDFAQIERNTKLLHARHNMLLPG
ncbi:hypothetical protein ZHAS_00015586 [Anopheles sinensis]|uniref:Uncharacterized protein n=1 Tax=Anopheles sinensis TaxID=74873 RepID=A0A084WBM0_ANOSI|nr:hypothetical protein ZHAS_00015586 [Anopheles sinensis]